MTESSHTESELPTAHQGGGARPPVLRVSERAAARVKALLAKAERPALGVRLSIKKGGCAGMEYAMDYAYARAPGDEMVAAHGVTVFVAAPSLLFLFGTEMDYEHSEFSSGFVFKNPNQTDACGCGESVTLAPTRAAPASSDA
ncbi:MAG: iron-sulfur cluster assembly accessory protein [Hyphomicrobiales bacterium]|nr:iron-sulfur cluster assembly accessory protein [Hyphomicrobiales bacterium]